MSFYFSFYWGFGCEGYVSGADECSYYHVDVGGKTIEDAVWYYKVS